MDGKPHLDYDWLREKYIEEGLTQSEISDLAGVSQGTISHHIGKSDIDTRTGGKWIGSETPDEPYTDPEWLREQYIEKRKNTREIAETQGVTSKTISRWLRKHDIPTRDNSEAQIQEVKKFHDKEWLRERYVDDARSMRDIADECGVTPSGIKNWIDKFGIETRDSTAHYRHKPASYFTSEENGYEYVSARYNYDTDSAMVHQLVAIADGANPSKIFSNGRYHVHHRNGVKWDNRPENLELQSAQSHAVTHHHADKHAIPDDYATASDKVEVLFEIRRLVNSWRENGNSTMGMCTDELDGALREL